ncbi:MAG: alpha/beta hydrolase [Bacilli bacterium]
MNKFDKEFPPKDFKEPGNGFRFSGGKPPMDGIPPLVDVTYVKRKFLDVNYGDGKPHNSIDIYLPETGEGPFPLLIHIHGGGFAIGDKRDGHVKKLLDAIDKGYAFASIQYHLSDESIFPQAVLDCREAIRFLKKHADEYHLDPNRIGTIGGSAGGNLSAMLAMNIPNGKFIGEEDKTFDTDPTIKMAIDWFGPTDFKVMDEQAMKNGISFTDHNADYSAESCYIGKPLKEADAKLCDKANPMTYVSDLMAPLLIEHGTHDKLVPFGQSIILFDKIVLTVGEGRAFFHPLENADHKDKMFESDHNMEIVWNFVKANL